MVEHVETSLTQVRTVPVRTQRIPLSQLRVPPARIQELRSVESSMRCDSIASAGFRISRQKASDLIKGGDVRVNWRGGVKPSYEIRQGDVISCSGKGRVEVKAVSETKKGKFAVEMVRYI
jgi:RNA-binding protein YlmH